MKVVAIVQARMGSKRLPGKVMLDLAGRPVIDRVLERVRRIPMLHQIVVATTVQDSDDELAAHLSRSSTAVFRGSEDDVLDRYYRAASQAEADAVMRITADCPLLSPHVSGRVLAAFLADDTGVDYISNTVDRCYPRGLDTEVFKFEALERAWKTASAPADREHVTPFLYRNPKTFKIAQWTASPDRSSLRWTLDTPPDYELIGRIYAALANHPTFEYEDVLLLLEEHPSWSELNRFVVQKQYGE